MKQTAYLASLLLALGASHGSLYANVTILSMTPSVASPQPLGTPVTWTVTATDTSSNQLTFQFNVCSGAISACGVPGAYALAVDYNIGTLSVGTWTSQPFVWTTIQREGTYTIQVIAKDFTSGETATQTASYTLKALITAGTSAVHATAHPLVALYSAPKCPSGSLMRVTMSPGTSGSGTIPQTYTSWLACNGITSMNFYVGGMYPSTLYHMQYQLLAGKQITNGPTVLPFTAGPLPTSLPPNHFLPTFTVTTPGTDTTAPYLLYSFTKVFVPVATDLDGQIVWYYSAGLDTLLTRPVSGGTFLTIQDGTSWGTTNTTQQLLREVDLAGNTIHETNTGVISNQLVALGATDAAPCASVHQPAPVGTACLDDFHHDAIRYTINGKHYTAFFAHIEKLYGPGTQNNNSGNVDILGEMVIVLNSNWQVVWYYDAFQQLDIHRTAPLNETCSNGSSDCPTKLTLGTVANDWTHANTLQYVSATSNPDYGDFIISMRDQDQVIRVNYSHGTLPAGQGGNVVWYMGPPDNLPPSNFTLMNTSNDPWPWFSHQHDVNYANYGNSVTINGITGPVFIIFDNGNTRVAAPPLGLGGTPGCAPNDCHSRGMALIVDESNFTVWPVLSQDLGVYSTALGGAQMLPNMNYFYQPGLPTYAIEIQPTPGGLTGSQILNVSSTDYSYRAFQLSDLYSPPQQ